MKLKATDPKAKNIVAVFVDKKRIAFPVEFDTKAGWVIGLVFIAPDVNKDEVKDLINPDLDDPTEASELGYYKKKFEGQVDVTFLPENKDA